MKKILLLSLLFLTSCTRLGFALRWADTFVMSSVSDYFELTSDQDAKARGDFKAALSEIQKKDFPDFAGQLESFANLVEKKESSDKAVDQFLDQMDLLFKRSMARFEPMAQNLLADQANSDYKLFDKEFTRKHDKDLQQAKDEKEQFKKALKNVDRFVDETVEFLTDEQKNEVESSVKSQPAPTLLQLESRKALFEKFKSLRKDDEKRKEFISIYLKDWNSLQTPAYQKARAEMLLRIRGLFKKIVSTMTEKQRKNLVENFRIRAEDLREISAK